MTLVGDVILNDAPLTSGWGVMSTMDCIAMAELTRTVVGFYSFNVFKELFTVGNTTLKQRRIDVDATLWCMGKSHIFLTFLQRGTPFVTALLLSWTKLFTNRILSLRKEFALKGATSFL